MAVKFKKIEEELARIRQPKQKVQVVFYNHGQVSASDTFKNVLGAEVLTEEGKFNKEWKELFAWDASLATDFAVYIR